MCQDEDEEMIGIRELWIERGGEVGVLLGMARIMEEGQETKNEKVEFWLDVHHFKRS